MRRCRNQNRLPHPALSAGLLVNGLFLTLRVLLPEPYPGGPGAEHPGGAALPGPLL